MDRMDISKLINPQRGKGNCSVCNIEVEDKMITHCDECARKVLECQGKETKENKVLQLFSKLALPYSLETVTLDSLDWYKSQEDCLSYIEKFKLDKECYNGPYLFGEAGTGKTVLAVCLLKKLISEYQVEGMFVNVAEFLLKHRASSLNSTTILELMSAQVLVLDDIGNHNISKFVTEILYSIINTRITSRRTTIITSNFSPLGLCDAFIKHGIESQTAKSIRDRLLELCNPIKLNDTNIRYDKSMLRIRK